MSKPIPSRQEYERLLAQREDLRARTARNYANMTLEQVQQARTELDKLDTAIRRLHGRIWDTRK